MRLFTTKMFSLQSRITIPKFRFFSVNRSLIFKSRNQTCSILTSSHAKYLRELLCSVKFMNLKVHAFNFHSCSNEEQKESMLTKNDSKSCFQRLLHLRKKQAESSILLKKPSKEDINSVTSICEEYGTIKSLYAYPGECGNTFLLLEFVDENSCRNLLLNCQCSNIADSIPICTRLIKFKRKYEYRDPKMPVDVIEDMTTASDYKPETVSNVIKSIYTSEQLSELSIRLRFFFCAVIKDSISGLFPNCDVIPFGSSVNGIGREGCDLDVMIRLYPEQMDESADVTNISQLAICVKMVFSDFTTKEEFLKVLPLKGSTRGEDIFSTFKKYIADVKLPVQKLSSMTTDGAPAMT
ncbi:poly(A) RNA polymerase, mitochondrial-like, partial [Stegodyphus dumicola]|uniref:poly(A) RNA polymerase, mitochondrial-like n=1 Tax=Stegodyphus dumicola TaxID=202533 RepID=UPI0015B0A3BA